MAGFLRPSEASSLGLHAALLLAHSHADWLRTREIASKLQASNAHLAKVLKQLEQAGLLHARRGPHGGYRLAKPAAEITLREVYEAIEGRLHPERCPFSLPLCQQSLCPLGSFLCRLSRQVADKLSQIRLSTIRIGIGADNEDKAKDNQNRRRQVYRLRRVHPQLPGRRVADRRRQSKAGL